MNEIFFKMANIMVPIVPMEKKNRMSKRISARGPRQPVWNAKSVKFRKEEYSGTGHIELVLLGMGMEKYVELLLKSGVTLEAFLQLDESDLRELGITDVNDIQRITQNLRIYQTNQKKFDISDSPVDDLQIARNVSNELILLENYCKYLELQMRRRKLTDYRINLKETAATYLKAFATAAAIQVKIVNERIFQDSNDDCLINKVLKINNLTLTKDLKEKLKNKNPKRKKKLNKTTIIAGILSLVIFLSFYRSRRI